MSLSIFTELEITQDLKISNDLEILQNIDICGNILMSGVDSTLNLKTIKSNRSTNIDPCGNYVDISGSALLVPRGPYESRMSIDGTLDIGATAKAGMIMYDTSQNQFIGVIDTAKPNSDGPELVWTGLGGVISTDQKTSIEATNDGTNNSGLKFFTNNNYNMCINENGNVGIGDAMVSANDFLLNASDLNLFTNNNASFLISNAFIATNVGFAAPDFGGGLKLTFDTDGNAKIYNTYSTGDLIFGSGGYNDRMRILANGNVCIGADSPKTKLQIGDIANFQEGYMHTTSSGEGSWDTNSMLIIHPEPTSNTALNNPKPVLYLSRKGTSGESFGALATFSISRYENSDMNSRTRLDIKLDDDAPGLTQPTDVMTLLANGNVGIGTSSPSKKLHISGDGGNSAAIKIESTNSSDSGYMYIQRNADGKSYVLNTGSYPLILGASNNTSQLYLRENGNVGIGTTSPGSALHVVGPIDTTPAKGIHMGVVNDASIEICAASTSNSSYIDFCAPNDNYRARILCDLDLHKLIFSTNSVERMVIDNTGRVGIGTTSPQSKLHIGSGNVVHKHNDDFDTNAVMIVHPTVTSNAVINDPQDCLFLGRDGTGGEAYAAFAKFSISRYENVSTNSRTRLDIGLTHDSFSWNSVMSLRSNGNVGIGTTTPEYTLDVYGTIGATGDITAFHTSDKRLKNNLIPIKDPLEKLKKINGYTFVWKESEHHSNKGNDVGVIAQEVEEILPEVTTTRQNGYKAVRYEKLTPFLISCIKEQQKQIESLQYQIDELKELIKK